MKKLTTIIAMALLLATSTMAQEQKRPRFNPEEFKAKMESYIVQKAELTQSESETVLPIFFEMKEKQRKLMQNEQKLKQDNAAAKTDKDCQTILNEITNIRVESAKIGAAYYKKMSKAISPQKVYRIMCADDSFHREMLRRYNNNPKDKHGTKGRP